ncbi:MAG TPA: hypothetical protein P5531_04075 [Bacteroidales bacterium]|nr:hypothetical protein [Bacteroidales bacterium]
MEVVRKEMDAANRYRVTVCLDGIETIMLKFHDPVSDQQAIQVAEGIVLQRQQEEQRQQELEDLQAEEQQLLNDLENGYYQESK